jgi:hypothetical protein
MIASGNFPKPIRIDGGQSAYRVESDERIQQHIDAGGRQRDNLKKLSGLGIL